MKYRIILIIMLVWLLSVLACNLPVSQSPRTQQAAAEKLSAAETLAARQSNPQRPQTGPVGLPPSSTQTATPYPDLPDLPIVTVVATPTTAVVNPPAPPTVTRPESGAYQYVSQSGDTIAGLAKRFGLAQDQIPNAQQYPTQALLPIGEQMTLPNTLPQVTPPEPLMPDSEVVYSPSTIGFSVDDYVQSAGGFLSSYSENVDGQPMTGAQIIQRVADETSINPRLLLAFLEYRSHWVFGSPSNASSTAYPIGFAAGGYSGLYKEITLVARQLTIGYYGWRSGDVTQLNFLDSTHQRINPTVNAGTAAVQYLFAVLYTPADWQAQLYTPGRFIAFYHEKMGDAWQRAAAVEPMLPDGLAQPPLELPFAPGMSWSFTGGPHAAWGIGSPWGGMDFAPANVEKGCTVSRFWAGAVAPGRVVRSGNAQVLEDLDGDGHEQSGWVILYLHIAEKDRIPVGTVLNTGAPVGHPSCEGGFATGTHVHISRKYNGEWLAANAPLPFVLSGWQAQAGDRQYSGSLIRSGQIVTARPDGASTSLVTR